MNCPRCSFPTKLKPIPKTTIFKCTRSGHQFDLRIVNGVRMLADLETGKTYRVPDEDVFE